MIRDRVLPLVLSAAVLSACSAPTTQPLVSSWNMLVRQDGSPRSAMEVCPNPQNAGSRKPLVCADPGPDPYANWDLRYAPNDVGFGSYSGLVSVGYTGGNRFLPTLGKCIAQTAADTARDALILYTAVKSAASTWESSPSAAQVSSLLGAYAAGEIGAAAFVAGIVAMLPDVIIAGLLVGTGVSLYDLVKIVGCTVSGNG